MEHTDAEFGKLYAERKDILKGFVDSLEEVVDFCKVLISDPLFCVFPMARNDYFSFPLHQHLLCKKFVSIVIALKSKKVKAHFDALTVAYIGRVANENYF